MWSKKNVITILLINLVFCYSNAQSNSSNFVAIPITKNVFSIVSPSVGLPTPKNKGWNSNSHFVITKTGVLIFDTGSSQTIGNKIKKAIKSITNKPVRWVINSHSHADHWLGNAAFPNAEIISSESTLKIMKKYGEEDIKFFSKVTKGTIGSTQLLYPTKLLTKNQKFNFGETEVELIFSNGGHSPGDILMWLPKQKIIFGGDVLSSDYMPMLTGHRNISNLINTLHSITELKPSIVLTGHGRATTKKSILRDINLLSDVSKLVKKGFEKGKTQDEILLKVKNKLTSKYSSLYKNFDSEINRYVELMYKLHQ